MTLRTPARVIKLAIANRAEVPVATWEGNVADFPND
jgi:hypothetical protein